MDAADTTCRYTDDQTHCWHERRFISRVAAQHSIGTYEERCCHCGIYRMTTHALTLHGPFAGRHG